MTFRVLCTGQSNALGADPGGPLFSTCNSRVKMWNNEPPGPIWGDTWIYPPNLYNQNLGVWFCDEVAKTLDTSVKYIVCAAGGRPITDWLGTGHYMFDALTGVYQHALACPADVLLWHQGEANSSMTYDEYSADFLAMLAFLRGADILSQHGKVIVGGLSEQIPIQSAFNQTVLQQLAADHFGEIAYAPSTGLVTIADQYHFTGQSLYDLGRRYFDAYSND